MSKNALFYLALLTGLVFLAQSMLNDYYQRILSVVFINIILTVSLNLTNGFVGDFSLGHAAFMSIGAYLSAVLTLPPASKASMMPQLPMWLSQLEVPFVLATILGGLLAALVAAVVGIPVLRLRGHYLAVATLGLMVIVRVVAINWTAVTRGAKGINGLPAFTNLWWVFGWALVTVYVIWRLVNSSYGRAMIAIREDATAAAARGVNVTAHRMLAFCVGAFFAGIAGALWGHLITAITPHSFSFLITFNVVVMLVVGGMGSISGSILGATVMTLVPEFLRHVETNLSLGGHPLYGLSQIIIAVTITLVMIFRRQGLLGGREVQLPRLFDRQRALPRARVDTAG
ncbi:MAG: branched-chain amino acid ABC transporter permease [Anaerolineae bacterium]|nr:branched-chain amino acid ABC transporter permease [Anaerolineae bacterium]MDW8070288.1 branched-chain amino acid ABC transporter permease [Anaerolineae bacterium]